MWLQDDGIWRTVSPADPAVVVGTSCVSYVRGLGRIRGYLISSWVEWQMNRFYAAARPCELCRLPAMREALPDTPVLGEMASFIDLRREIGLVRQEWQLDVLSTLDELLE